MIAIATTIPYQKKTQMGNICEKYWLLIYYMLNKSSIFDIVDRFSPLVENSAIHMYLVWIHHPQIWQSWNSGFQPSEAKCLRSYSLRVSAGMPADHTQFVLSPSDTYRVTHRIGKHLQKMQAPIRLLNNNSAFRNFRKFRRKQTHVQEVLDWYYEHFWKRSILQKL